MNPALQKTLIFLLLILAGFFLQKKIDGRQDLKGVKVLILSVILPATIFVALLKINISFELLLLPAGALFLNLLLFYAARFCLPRLGLAADSPNGRTLLLLVPSLAPGLSCFPFVVEYLGDESLAMAALADVGNKIFVLIILYLVAMNWYYRQQEVSGAVAARPGKRKKLKDLGLSLLREPVNLVILVAVGMLCLGLNLEALPSFLESTIVRLAALMTPIVLLFIGMAVRFERNEMVFILRVLAFRAGIGLLISGAAMLILPPMAPAFTLLLVIFPQSAVSFWPFAHMSAVGSLGQEHAPKIFNVHLALNVLACSLPFSTVVILTILSFGTTFAQPASPLVAGALFLLLPLIYAIRTNITLNKSTRAKEATSHRMRVQESQLSN